MIPFGDPLSVSIHKPPHLLILGSVSWLTATAVKGAVADPRRLIYTGVADISPENVRWPEMRAESTWVITESTRVNKILALTL